jgi:hypothetical protein
MRTLHLIRPRRIPSRRRLVNNIGKVPLPAADNDSAVDYDGARQDSQIIAFSPLIPPRARYVNRGARLAARHHLYRMAFNR